MNDRDPRPVAVPRFIATRYVSVGKRSQLVSFMSAIAILGLALGIAILITVLSVMNGFDREMRESILGIVPHITLFSDENLSAEAWQELNLELQSNPRITSIMPVISVSAVTASDTGSRAVLVNGIDAASEEQGSSIDRFMQQGSLERLADQRWGVVLGATLAQQLGVQLGDRVDLFSTTLSPNPLTPLPTFRGFEVSGIFRVGTRELDEQLVLINIDAARALFRLRSPYNGLRLQGDDVLAADSIALELRRSLPAGLDVDTWSRQFGSIYENIRFSRTIIALMLWLLVAVAAFNLVVSLIMIVRDKTGDIAILRTLGASPRTINRIFMWQGCLIALFGIIIGVSFGIVGALQAPGLAAFIENRFGMQILSAEVYPIDFLPSQLKLGDIVVVVTGVFLLSLLAALYPARRAAAIQPAAALRAD